MIKNVLYVSALCSKRVEKDIVSTCPKLIALQIQKYHRILAKGFVLNGISTTTLSYNKSACIVCDLPDQEKENGIEYHYIKTKNFGMLTHIKVVGEAFFRTIYFVLKNQNSFVLCDVLNLSVSLGAGLAARLMKKELVGIVTDLPDMVTKSKKDRGPYWWLISLCTSYVLLTDAMRERIKVHDKKYVVLEGHVDIDILSETVKIPNEDKNRHCIYAGGLNRKYGVEKLVKAFQRANISCVKLDLYGNGDYVEKLRELNDSRICYHGIVANEEVVDAEQHAVLLINPRPTTEEFTKYSFPSKNMEYMASGTPVLTTNLPGMPCEYLDYVYLFDDESIEGMAKTLTKILNNSPEILREKGESARNFVLKRKNNMVQACKILTMIGHKEF